MIYYRSISVSYTILYIFMRKRQFRRLPRAQMVVFHDAEFSQAQISKQLNISHRYVPNAVNKYKHFGIYERS